MIKCRARLQRYFWAVALVAASVVATADVAPDGGTLSVVMENDKVSGTDRQYTNGWRVAWLGAADHTDPFGRLLATRVLGHKRPTHIRQGFAFGQSIYTPQDIEVSEPLPKQHPYSAWLYGEYAIVVERSDQVDRLSIQLGLAGKGAGGEVVQNEIHRLFGIERARGWDNALEDEVGAIISFDRKFRARPGWRVGRFATDVTPSFGVSVGNIYAGANAGLMFRLGSDLRNDYGPPRVRPALAGAGSFTPRDQSSWYVFAGANARWVAQNFFLEGSLFRSVDEGVNAKSLVFDYQAGVAVQRGKYQLSGSLVRRSDEYENQDRAQVFGAISLAVRF